MSSSFKITNVHLFSHGMAFFTYSGKILKSKENFFPLKVKKKDLNDILNSMIVSTSKGTITSISYTSDVAETIDKKYLSKSNYINYLVDNFRGSKAVLSTSQDTSFVGVISGKESYSNKIKKKKTIDEYIIMFDQGIFKQIPFNNIKNIKIENITAIEELTKALKVSSTQNEEEIVLKFFYECDQDQFDANVGFMIEIPLWKINYRLILPSPSNEEVVDEVILDSYCLITNSLDEDWIDVNMSLITGRPVSFIYNLNRIDYLKRTNVPPPLIEATATINPPSFNSLDYNGYLHEVSSDTSYNGYKTYMTDIETGSSSIIKQSHLNKLRLELIQNVSNIIMKDNKSKSKPLDEFDNLSKSDDFAGMNLGENFIFKLKGLKNIKKNENAIVPLFSNLKLPCKKLLYFDTSKNEPHPYTSIEISNKAPYPLEFGPAVVFESNSPVGEAIIPTCFTGQSRIISYSKEPRIVIKEKEIKTIETKTTYELRFGPLFLLEVKEKENLVTFDINSQLSEEDMKNDSVLLVLDYNFSKKGTLDENILDDFIKVKSLESGKRYSLPLKDKKYTLKLVFKWKESNRRYYKSITKEQYLILKDNIPEKIDDLIEERMNQKFKLSDEKVLIELKISKLSNNRLKIESYIKRIRNNLTSIPEKSNKSLRSKFVEKLTNYEEEIDEITKEIEKLNNQIKQIDDDISSIFKKASGAIIV